MGLFSFVRSTPGSGIWMSSRKFSSEPRKIQKALARTTGPVGWDIPPIGSMVTPKALQLIPAGILAMHICPPLKEAGIKAPALMGLPTIGTIHIWYSLFGGGAGRSPV